MFSIAFHLIILVNLSMIFMKFTDETSVTISVFRIKAISGMF